MRETEFQDKNYFYLKTSVYKKLFEIANLVYKSANVFKIFCKCEHFLKIPYKTTPKVF